MTHIILRGGKEPNYEKEDVNACIEKLDASEINKNIMIDFSHGNSKKNHENQKVVCDSVCKQIAEGNKHIAGVMIESHLKAGNQKISDELEYGKSITDACICWDETKELLLNLSQSVKQRREIG